MEKESELLLVAAEPVNVELDLWVLGDSVFPDEVIPE